MKKAAILAAFLVAVVLMCTAYAIGQNRGFSRGVASVHLPDSSTTTTTLDTLTDSKPKSDTVRLVEYRTKRVPVHDTIYVAMEPDAGPEPMDTIDVDIPISRYVAHRDSLYHVEVTGYDVEFEKVQVYPKTVTVTSTVEKLRTTRWGLGVQAGYGATLQGGTVRLSPYVGVGISYNLVSW